MLPLSDTVITDYDKRGEDSSGNLGSIVVVADSVSDRSEECGDGTSEYEREQEKSEEFAGVGLKSSHEVDDNVQDD